MFGKKGWCLKLSFDIKTIQNQVALVLAHSQNINNVNIDELMKKWLEAKRDIIEAFDGKLIVEVPEPITFHLSSTEKQTRLDDFINLVEHSYHNLPLAWFIHLNRDGFYENQVIKDYICPNGEKINAGMKLLKAFKFFEQNESTLKQIQDKASMIIQGDKIEGILCFSVHPLDYLSSSENIYNWRSCHALDGEYRSGNLSYMCDKSTIVCYLRGKEGNTYILPRFPQDVPWNSKKWRMLIFLSESWRTIFAGRQYPFMSEGGLDIITPYLHKALKLMGSWSAWHDDVLTKYRYKNDKDSGSYDYTYKTVIINSSFYDLEKLVEDGKGSRHFNDLLHSGCYTPFYSWQKTYRTEKPEHFIIGAAAPCIACGKEDIGLSEAMFCPSCGLEYIESEAVSICDCCGSRDFNDNMITTVDGSWICEYCRDNECYVCPCCDRYVFKSDAILNQNNDSFYCPDCYNEFVTNINELPF